MLHDLAQIYGMRAHKEAQSELLDQITSHKAFQSVQVAGDFVASDPSVLSGASYAFDPNSSHSANFVSRPSRGSLVSELVGPVSYRRADNVCRVQPYVRKPQLTSLNAGRAATAREVYIRDAI
jgi:hypothetical protein